jgi:hypothetical protein
MKKEERERQKLAPMVYTPKPGFAFNPAVTRIGRNEPCPCKSGKKFKKCHLATQMRVIPAEAAAELAAEFRARERK